MNDKLLVVWSEVPEEICFIEIRPKTAKERDMLESWHNHYINAEDEPDGMNDYFYTKEGKFKFEKIKTPVDPNGYSKVLIMGFLL